MFGLGLLAGIFASASAFAQDGPTADAAEAVFRHTIVFPRKLTRPVVTDQAIWVGQGGLAPIWEAPLHAICRVDPQTRVITARIPLDSQPIAIAEGGGAIWVQQQNNQGSLVRIDERTLQPAPVPGVGWCGSFFSVLAFGEGSVWIVEKEVARAGPVILYERGMALVRLDPRTGQVLARIPVPPVHGIAVGAGAVWVVRNAVGFEKSSAVLRIDAATNKIVATIPVASGVDDITIGEGFVWVVRNQFRAVGTSGPSELVRIDPATNGVVGQPIRLPRGFSHLAIGHGAVWVATATGNFDGLLVRLDPRTGQQLGEPLPIPNLENVADGPLGVWVSRWDRPKGKSRIGLLTPIVP
jgi:DNA-binding beta-propeller fold protein YncE